jgi:hypothetical protein
VAAGTTLNTTFLAVGFTYRLPAGSYTLNETIKLIDTSLCIQGSGSDAATGTVIQFKAANSGARSANITGTSAFLGLSNLSYTIHPSSAAKDVGSVNVDSGATLIAEGVAFRGIGGASAGAVRAFTGGAVNLTDALFEDCFASSLLGVGGAMFIGGGSSADLYGATTIVRTYASGGGAFRVYGGTLRFHGPVTATNVTVLDRNEWAGPGEGGEGGQRQVGRGSQTGLEGGCMFRLKVAWRRAAPTEGESLHGTGRQGSGPESAPARTAAGSELGPRARAARPRRAPSPSKPAPIEHACNAHTRRAHTRSRPPVPSIPYPQTPPPPYTPAAPCQSADRR